MTKNFFEQLMGTSIKQRVLRSLVLEGDGVTRHELGKRIDSGMGPLYQQVDHLIALGVLREDGRKIFLDDGSPFLPAITDLLITSEGYLDDIGRLLSRIDAIFGNDYYITGYLAACQNGFPVDHEPSSIEVAILLNDRHAQNFIEALNDCTSVSLKLLEAEEIPSDVRRTDILGTEVWAASIERSLVGMLSGDLSLFYPFSLLLAQNFLEDALDINNIIDISGERKVMELAVTALSELPDIPPGLPDIESPVSKAFEIDEMRKAMRMALNTITGGY